MMQNVKFLFITLVFSSTVYAQAINKEQAVVQQAVENMFATLSAGDTLALKGFVTANVRFYEYGQVWPIDTLIQKVLPVNSIPDFKRTNRFDFVSTRIQHKTAWVTYYLESIITRNGKQETLNWLETVVLIRERGNWKIDVLHSTRIIK